MTFRRQWGSTVWGPPKNYEEEEVSDCSTNAWKAPSGKPTLRLHAEFDSGNDWDYTLALNGRRLTRFEIDGRRQVDAPERDWDSEVSD